MRFLRTMVVVAAAAIVAAGLYLVLPAGGEGPGDEARGTQQQDDATPSTGDGGPRDAGQTLTGRDQAVAARPVNLLDTDQHSFRDSIRGWTPQGNTTLARETSTSFTAEASLAIRVDDSGPWPDDTRTARAGTSHEQLEGVRVVSGATYRAWWRILAEHAARARCELRWYGGDGSILDTVEGDTVPTDDSWTLAACEGTSPHGTEYASVRVHLSEVDYGMVFFVDDVWLVEAGDGGSEPQEDERATETPEVATGEGGPSADEPDDETAGATQGPVTGTDGAPAHGEDVGTGNTGPTAFYDETLGRTLTYDDLEPSGSITTSHDGQVIERKDVSGEIRIAHDDVVIRAVRVRNQGSRYSISYEPNSDASGAELAFVEVDGNEDPDNIGVFLSRFTMRHAHVHGQSTGVRFGTGSTIEYSYVHSQALQEGSHNTAMSKHGGSGSVVRFNNLEGSTSSALSLYPRTSPLVDILVEGNLFNGGSYCTYAGGGSKDYADQSREIRYIGNKFGDLFYPDCGQYGPVNNFDRASGNEWRGNTWQRSGDSLG